MRRNIIETVMGALVLMVAAAFLWFASRTAQVNVVAGYPISASFFSVGGLPVGSDVRVSGVKVGTVTGRRLDPQTFAAVVTMNIDPQIRLPQDTVASITGEGVLGGKFIRLQPGRSTTPIEPGGILTDTRPYRSLEDQVGEIIFLATGQSGSGPKE